MLTDSPDLVSRYDIIECIYSGRMSNVYRARHRHLGDMVAIKEGLLTDEASREAFLREAKRLLKLRFELVPRIRDFITHNDKSYLIMEYIEGDDLGALASRSQAGLPLANVALWMDSLLRSLEHLHKEKIYHRDIKPQNLKPSPNRGVDELFLLDFGISHSEAVQGQQPDMVVNAVSAGYSPPEHYDFRPPSVQGDIYSVGATLYTLLTGEVPADAPTRRAALLAGESDPITTALGTSKSIPPSVSDVIAQAMELSPQERFSTAAAMRGTLARIFTDVTQLRSIITETTPLTPIPAQEPPYTNNPPQVQPPPIVVGPTEPITPRTPEANEPRQGQRGVDRESQVKGPSHSALSAWYVIIFATVIVAVVAVVTATTWPRVRTPAPERTPENRAATSLPHTLGATSEPVPTAPILTPITTRTAHQVIELARWGNGVPSEVAVSPDGSLVAVASSIGLFLYGEELEQPRLLSARYLTSVAFSKNGAQLATGAADGSVYLWSLPEGARVQWYEGHTGAIRRVGFAFGDKRIVSASEDGTIRIWDAERADMPLHILRGHTLAVTDLAISPNGEQVVSVSDDGTVHLWNASSGVYLWQTAALTDTIDLHAVAFHPESKGIAVGGTDEIVRLLDPADGELQTAYRSDGPIHALTFSADGSRLAIASGAHVRHLQVPGGELIGTLTTHSRDVSDLHMDPRGGLWSVSEMAGEVFHWSLAEQVPDMRLDDFRPTLNALALNSDEELIAAAGEDGTIHLLEGTTGQVVRQLRGHAAGIAALDFSPTGDSLASASSDWTVRLWRIESGANFTTLFGHSGWVRSVAFSPDGVLLASASHDGSVRLWRTRERDVLHVLPHNGLAWDAAFSPDGRTVATAADNTVQLWDVSSASLLHTMKGGHRNWVQTLAVSPDGHILASASLDDTVRLWHLPDGESVATLQGSGTDIGSVAWSPDGTVVATGSQDGAITLWDAATHEQLAHLDGHTNGVNDLIFNAVGNRLFSSAADGTVRVWGVGEKQQ